MAPDASAGVRLDKWLWAARFFKTRALAVEAIAGGKVEVGEHKGKPGRAVHPGDRLRIRLGPYEHRVTVVAVAERRGPAALAAALYEEDPAGLAARLTLAEQHRLARQSFDHGEGKPSKLQRRALLRFKRGE